jgi:hypothetical protein
VGQAGAVLSRLGGGRAAAWLLVAVFAVFGTAAVLRSQSAAPGPGKPAAQGGPVALPGSISLAAPPTPLPDESATGGAPPGQLTLVPPATPGTPASVAPGPDGIPGIPYAAYQRAQQALAASAPGCHLSWPVLAAVGRVESGHAEGGRVDASGRTLDTILGPRLDGTAGLPRVADTDSGGLDGDRTWDRPVGPMQIVPSVWRRYGADGDGDGRADPNDVYDAALTAGRYLCAGGMNLADDQQRGAALYRYDDSDAFVAAVRGWTASYGQGTGAVPLVPVRAPAPAAVPPVAPAVVPPVDPAVVPPVAEPAPRVRTESHAVRPARPHPAPRHQPAHPAPHPAPRHAPAGPDRQPRAATPGTTDPKTGRPGSAAPLPAAGPDQNLVVPPAPGSRVTAGAPGSQVTGSAPPTLRQPTAPPQRTVTTTPTPAPRTPAPPGELQPYVPPS